MQKTLFVCIGQVFFFETLIFNHIEEQSGVIFINEFDKSGRQQIDLKVNEKISTTLTPFVINPLDETDEDIASPQKTYGSCRCFLWLKGQKKKPTPKARSPSKDVLFLFPHKTKWLTLTCQPFFYFTTTFFGFFVSLRCRSFPFAICVMIIF